MSMLPRERVLSAIAHKLPDRTPTALWLRNETKRLLLSHFQTDSMDDVYRALGVDWWQSVDIKLTTPHLDGKRTKVLQGDMLGAGREYFFNEDGTYEDGWGVVFRVGSDGKYIEHVRGPFSDDIDKLSSYEWPRVSEENDIDVLRKAVKALQKEWYVISPEIDTFFKRGWQLRGFENLLMDYYLNKDFLGELFDKFSAVALEQVEILAEIGIDCICILGDIATQKSLMIKPELWREFHKPRLAKLIETGRSIKSDIDFFFHSDGNINELMDDIIETGFNIINPFQPECMDCSEVKSRYGDKIVMHGCATCQRIVDMSVDEIKSHVTDIIKKCGMDGGLILMPSNVLPFDAPFENILAFYETARNINLSK